MILGFVNNLHHSINVASSSGNKEKLLQMKHEMESAICRINNIVKNNDYGVKST